MRIQQRLYYLCNVIRFHSDVAVADDEVVVRGTLVHLHQRADLGIGTPRLTAGHNRDRHGRIPRADTPGHFERGVIIMARAKNDLVAGVLLLEESSEMFFQSGLHAADRL